MNKEQQMVREFHRKFGCVITEEVPEVPTAATLLTRTRLLTEELAEFVEAASKRDLTGCADALGDLLYVTYGTALSFGFDMEPIFREIHRSNMTKTPGRDTGGKVIKGPSYEPPRLGLLVDAKCSVTSKPSPSELPGLR